ncbi:MAG: hypothetical protein P0S96_07705 [Simkaniaceae bacterium]|nr:hypothetical protein [Candidatus Sacchlamyda saccharinae]
MAATLKNSHTQKYLRELPLLDFTADLYPDTNLENVYIICAQHLVSTTYSLFNTLIQLGLKPSNLAAIGKCYSTDPEAFNEMDRLGIDVCASSLSFDSHASFDQQYRSNIKKFIQKRVLKLRSKGFKKIIALDDGGELLAQVDSVLEKSKKVIGIEQTSSGYHKIKKKNLHFPIINVARSPAKLNYESPIIAELVLTTLLDNLKQLELQPGQALIIGNGPIGSHIREALEHTHEVFIYDKIASKSDIEEKEFEKSLKKFDLIIGCTGTPVLTPNQFKLLKKNAILVSTSSSDREFSADKLRKTIALVNDCHQNLHIDNKWLINCGFPINFSPNYRSIDCEKLQLTRSLLLSAILQAVDDVDTSEKRFIPLDLENQREILEKYFLLFAKEKPKEKIALAI